jgi:hypothetical protein
VAVLEETSVRRGDKILQPADGGAFGSDVLDKNEGRRRLCDTRDLSRDAIDVPHRAKNERPDDRIEEAVWKWQRLA